LFGGFAAHRSDLELLPSVILAGAVGNFLGGAPFTARTPDVVVLF
jgi:hypothetical protein